MTLTLREDIACFYEGTTEKAILDMLIDQDMLIFTRDNLVDEAFLPMQDLAQKKINIFCERVLRQVDEDEKMDILIVQDRSIVPKFANLYREKIGTIYILQTKPEIEMLLIHHHNLYDQYQKEKSKMGPKKFLSQKLRIPEKNLTSYKVLQEKYPAEVFQKAIIKHSEVSKSMNNTYQLVDILKR